MVKLSTLPKIPTPDQFRRALGKVHTDATHTDIEVVQFATLLQRALAAWPSGVPYEMLEVMVSAYGTDEVIHDFNRSIAILTARNGDVLAIEDDMGVDPGDFFVLACISSKEEMRFQDDLKAAGWVVDDSAPWTPKGLRAEPQTYAVVMLPPFDINESLQAEADPNQSKIDLAQHVHDSFRRALDDARDDGRGGWVAEDVDDAFLRELQSALQTDDETKWPVGDGSRAHALWVIPPLDADEWRIENANGEAVLTFADAVTFARWAETMLGIATEERDNPTERVFYVDDGEAQHGPFTFAEMAKNNAEHKDIVRALRKMKDEQELHVGGGAAPTFIIRCESGARENPTDVVVCKQHGWRHSPDEECIKCVEDRAPRVNPATIVAPSLKQLRKRVSHVHGFKPHTDDEIMAFVNAVQQAAALWPTDVPSRHLEVVSISEQVTEEGWLRLSVFGQRENGEHIWRVEPHFQNHEEPQGSPGTLEIAAHFNQEQFAQYKNDMMAAGWRTVGPTYGIFVTMGHPQAASIERDYIAAAGTDPAGIDFDGPDGIDDPLTEARANPLTAPRVQSLVFDDHLFSPSSAKKWASGHGFTAKKTDERDNTIRIRQDDPAYYAAGSFRTIQLAEGVQAIIGVPTKD